MYRFFCFNKHWFMLHLNQLKYVRKTPIKTWLFEEKKSYKEILILPRPQCIQNDCCQYTIFSIVSIDAWKLLWLRSFVSIRQRYSFSTIEYKSINTNHTTIYALYMNPKYGIMCERLLKEHCGAKEIFFQWKKKQLIFVIEMMYHIRYYDYVNQLEILKYVGYTECSKTLRWETA